MRLHYTAILVVVAMAQTDLAELESLAKQLDQTSPKQVAADAASEEVSGRPEPVIVEVEQRQFGPKSQIPSLNAKLQRAEQRAARLAQETRRTGPGKSSGGETLKVRVRREVEAAFEARQQLQRSELRKLRQQLARIEHSIAARERIRDKIIDHRIQELFNPNLHWNPDGRGQTTSDKSIGMREIRNRVEHVPPQVDAMVTSGPDKKHVIEISIGHDDGIRPGMRMHVSRNNVYLGSVLIVNAIPDKAFARIERERSQQPIRRGDRVTTRLESYAPILTAPVVNRGAAPVPTDQSAIPNPTRLLQPGDRVRFTLISDPVFKHDAIVLTDGSVRFPIVPDKRKISAAGKTIEELEAELEKRCGYDSDMLFISFVSISEAGSTAPSRLDPNRPLKPGDRVRIEHPALHNQLFPRDVTVLADGSIRLPHIDPLKAAGRTWDELEAELEKAYRGIIKSSDAFLVTRADELHQQPVPRAVRGGTAQARAYRDKLRERQELLDKQYKSAEIGLLDVLVGIKELFKAEAAAAETTEDRKNAFQQQVEELKKLEQAAKALFERGISKRSDYLAVEAALLKAQAERNSYSPTTDPPEPKARDSAVDDELDPED